MKITTYKYEKVPVKDTEIFIPEKPFYCFQTGVRRAIRIVPRMVDFESPTLKKGDVYELKVTCVYRSFECKIEKFNIIVHRIEDMVNRNEQTLEASIVRMLLGEDYYERTKGDFDEELREAISYVNE